MTLLIDTTKSKLGAEILAHMKAEGRGSEACKRIDAAELSIAPCVGCNFCWLKTPGTCVIRDDQEQILKEILKADRVFFVTDTSFGFVTHETKNIIDRIVPLLTMNLYMKGNQMRHVKRYEKLPDFGIVYTGTGDPAYLKRWCDRFNLNLDSKTLGVFSETQWKEAVKCI